jgi:hypothetical protein
MLRVDRQNRVYVGDRSAVTISRLSPDGREVELLVRRGGGPGEAESFVGMGWRGDTLWFYDNRLVRFTLLDPSGKFIRTIPHNERCTTTIPTALMAADGCLESLQLRSPPEKPFPVIVVSQGKQRVDTLGFQSYAHTTMIFTPKDGMFMTTQPFSDDALINPAPDGRGVLEVQRSAASSAQKDSIRLRRWDRGTGWGAWRGIAYEPVPLPERVIDSVLAVQAEQFKKFAGWVTLDSLQRRVYRPRFYPPAPVVLSTTDGSLWVKLITTQSKPGTVIWVVLDGALREQARLSAPAGLRILDARGDYCWGFLLDDDDVPHIVRYKLVPAP